MEYPIKTMENVYPVGVCVCITCRSLYNSMRERKKSILHGNGNKDENQNVKLSIEMYHRKRIQHKHQIAWDLITIFPKRSLFSQSLP